MLDKLYFISYNEDNKNKEATKKKSFRKRRMVQWVTKSYHNQIS